MLESVKHVVLVLSGKGVGKSTVSTQLALTLRERKLKIGILDIDLCGHSIPYLLGVEDKSSYRSANGWLAVPVDDEGQLCVMSMSFLLKNRNRPVIWRGPKKNAMIRQFLEEIVWGELDYLIVDTPPGTFDDHITIMQCMRSLPNWKGAVIVTTPQQVALADVRKEITFCKKTGIPIIGILENLSGFVRPHCTHCTNIFSSEGGQELAKYAKVPHLGTVPIDPHVAELSGSNRSVVAEFPNTPIAHAYNELATHIMTVQ